MKKMLLSILKQSGGSTPDNFTTTTTEITDGGLIFIGIIIGIILTSFAICVAKKLKKDNKDDVNNSDDKDIK